MPPSKCMCEKCGQKWATFGLPSSNVKKRRRWCQSCAKHIAGAVDVTHKMCEDCSVKQASFGFESKRWCHGCAKSHAGATRVCAKSARGQRFSFMSSQQRFVTTEQHPLNYPVLYRNPCENLGQSQPIAVPIKASSYVLPAGPGAHFSSLPVSHIFGTTCAGLLPAPKQEAVHNLAAVYHCPTFTSQTFMAARSTQLTASGQWPRSHVSVPMKRKSESQVRSHNCCADSTQF